jgi:hypothetical protein
VATATSRSVQRAVLRDGGLEAVGTLVESRLATVAELAAKPWTDLAASVLADLRRQAARWPSMDADARQVEARAFADALYHVVATSLLLAEGQRLRDRRDDFHKLLVGAFYARRWLAATAPGVPAFGAAELDALPALAEWAPIPRETLSRLGGLP